MRLLVAVALLCVMTASAQTSQKEIDWRKVNDLNGVDFSGLSTAQKVAAVKELRAKPCLCGCSMMIAECRVKDIKCNDSRGLAQIIVKAIRENRDPEYAINHSDLVARRTGAHNILEKPVPITNQGAPSSDVELQMAPLPIHCEGISALFVLGMTVDRERQECPAGRYGPQFAAMKMERPKPVRWCSAWSTPIRVQNQGCSCSSVTPKREAQMPLARSTVM